MKKNLSIQPFRQILCLIFSLVMIIEPIIGATKAFAIPDENFYSTNDILFYDPDASCGGASTAADISDLPNPIDMKNPEHVKLVKGAIWKFLTAKGLSNEQTAGVMGNLQAESGFNPTVVERGSGIGIGIAQWSFGRRDALEAAAAKKGITLAGAPTPDILVFELEYLYQELNARGTNQPEYKQYPNEWEMLRGQTTINDALVAFHHEFEVSHLMNAPNPRQAVIDARGQFAADIFASFSGSTPGAGGSIGGECEAAPTGNLAQTAIAYAWPDYHAPDYPQKKPEYDTAVNKARSQGRYVGGGQYPGVDCGGFVTTLMIDSGFEPGYNFDGRGGNTDTQRRWAEQNWQPLGSGSSINAADLQPGDVAFSPGHTFVYLGQLPGFGQGDNKFKGVVSASYLSWRAPMAGHEDVTAGNVSWFRKKSTGGEPGGDVQPVDKRL